jgi:predicted nucleic acid-binding protein
MRVVLDTNIIVAATLAPRGYTAKILHLAKEQAFDLIASEPVPAEYEESLNNPEVQRRHKLFQEIFSQEIVGGLRVISLLVSPTSKPMSYQPIPVTISSLNAPWRGELKFS